MTDYAIDVRIKNGRILKRMQECGFQTVAELSRACGVGCGSFFQLVNLRMPAKLKDGSWRPVVTRLADALCCSPEELFTDWQAEEGLPRTTARVFVEEARMVRLRHDLPQLIGPPLDDQLGAEQIADALEQAMNLADLTSRERSVIKARSEGVTLDEIGKGFDVTPERVRQIEQKAYRKMRRPGTGARELLEDYRDA